MGFYEGFSLLKGNGCLGRIRYRKVPVQEGVASEDVGEYMDVDVCRSEEEQVMTVIHECWHYSSEFVWYVGKKGDEKVEEEIERRTIETYGNNPVLVRCLRDAVRCRYGLEESIWRICRDLNVERKGRIFDRDCQMKFGFVSI